MSDTLTRPIVHELTGTVARLAASSRGAQTVRAYDSQWRQFTAWCEREGQDPYAGEHVIALNIAAAFEANLAPATVEVRLAAIAHYYRLEGIPVDLKSGHLGEVRYGLRRELGVAPRRQATAIRPEMLKAMLSTLRPSTEPKGARDSALLLLCYAAFSRRSEITALRVGDVVEDGPGLRVTFRQSKTDQFGAGQTVVVYGNSNDPSFCPVAAWRNWMAHRVTAADMQCPANERANRPLFTEIRKGGFIADNALTPKGMSLVLKKAAQDAGFDATSISGHSLRRGAMTAAAENGVQDMDLAKQARHKDLRMAMRYTNEANRWSNKASAAALGIS